MSINPDHQFISQLQARESIPVGRRRWYELRAEGVIPAPTVHKFPGSRDTGYTAAEWNEILAGLRCPVSEDAA